MKCPRCQRDSPPGQKFCGECGARLDAACPACGAPQPTGQKFCGECGASIATSPGSRFADPGAYTPRHLAEKILSPRSGLEGERKQVTVLFADRNWAESTAWPPRRAPQKAVRVSYAPE